MADRLDVPDENKCPYDAVFVFDGSELNSENPQYLGVYCGLLNDKLPEVISITNTMYVQFISDFSKNEEGFVGEISFSYGK